MLKRIKGLSGSRVPKAKLKGLENNVSKTLNVITLKKKKKKLNLKK